MYRTMQSEWWFPLFCFQEYPAEHPLEYSACAVNRQVWAKHSQVGTFRFYLSAGCENFPLSNICMLQTKLRCIFFGCGSVLFFLAIDFYWFAPKKKTNSEMYNCNSTWAIFSNLVVIRRSTCLHATSCWACRRRKCCWETSLTGSTLDFRRGFTVDVKNPQVPMHNSKPWSHRIKFLQEGNRKIGVFSS